MKPSCLTILMLLICVAVIGQQKPMLVPTPPMGWNSWNTFKTKINEQLVIETADAMVSSGMRDAGYNYLVLDDGWMAMERDAKGDLVADPVKFPSGIKKVIDYVHSKGLKFGLYNCAGTKTCAGFPGTRGYEYQDARYYASLEIDFLKYDWCYTDGINAKEAYTTMSNALNKTNWPIVFSICEWGYNKPWDWAPAVGHLWRTTSDIYNCFDCVKDYGKYQNFGVMQILRMQDSLRKYNGPNRWNDPDMMEVGNGMTVNENRSHFTMWAMLGAPLIAGNDIRSMAYETKAILTNKEMIAIAQDPGGIQGFRYAERDSIEIWLKPLKGEDWAICFLNRSSKTKRVHFDWSKEVVADTLTNRIFQVGKNKYEVKNIWDPKYIVRLETPLQAEITSHNVVVLKFEKLPGNHLINPIN